MTQLSQPASRSLQFFFTSAEYWLGFIAFTTINNNNNNNNIN